MVFLITNSNILTLGSSVSIIRRISQEMVNLSFRLTSPYSSTSFPRHNRSLYSLGNEFNFGQIKEEEITNAVLDPMYLTSLVKKEDNGDGTYFI